MTSSQSIRPLFATPWDNGTKIRSVIDADSVLDSDPAAGQGDGMVLLKDYVKEAMNPETVRANGSEATVFGRMQGAFQMLCAIGKLTSGAPTVGEQTIDFTSPSSLAKLAECEISAPVDENDQALPSMPYSVAAAADTTYYDYMLTFSALGQKVFYRVNDSVVNILSVEEYQRDGATYVSRVVASMDRANGNVRSSYFQVSYDSTSGDVKAGGNFNFYRVFVDGTTKKGTLMQSYGSFHGTTPTNFGLASNVVVLSVGTDGVGTSAFIGLTTQPVESGISDIKGCATLATGTISTNADTSCGSVTGIAAGSFETLISTAVTKSKSAVLAKSTATNFVSFTNASDVATADEF